MAMEKKEFGICPGGQKNYLYLLENKGGMRVGVMNFGAILVNLFVKDHEGNLDDVVLGYDNVEDYYTNTPFFGSVIGPNGNRIANAAFELDGKIYHLDVNDGPNNLHSHIAEGYQKRYWEAKEKDNSVTFMLDDPATMGFPGNKHCEVTYTLTEKNQLKIHYHVTSDAKTIINLTNHSYFNLDGQNGGNILEHTMQIYADQYIPVIKGAIPTGEIATVKETPMDFTIPKKIGERIDEDFLQLNLTSGYDHNWIPRNYDGKIRAIAKVEASNGQRIMNVYSDLPGVQFYAGNFIMEEIGKAGIHYGRRGGLCLETQYYPDTPNHPNFPSCIFGPEKEYDATTIFEFN